ncbi:hypothetical protein GS682_32830 [Nostoc sp. B(2019)]|nr:hypothetical protein [Nostoc sp. B(2019)]
MNIDRLQSLKQKLASEADLSNIWLFYMDHFADHAEFTDLGEPIYPTFRTLTVTHQQKTD